jgi:hypothetical protein
MPLDFTSAFSNYFDICQTNPTIASTFLAKRQLIVSLNSIQVTDLQEETRKNSIDILDAAISFYLTYPFLLNSFPVNPEQVTPEAFIIRDAMDALGGGVGTAGGGIIGGVIGAVGASWLADKVSIAWNS